MDTNEWTEIWLQPFFTSILDRGYWPAYILTSLAHKKGPYMHFELRLCGCHRRYGPCGKQKRDSRIPRQIIRCID
jgi:hypothetical protein